MPSAPAREGEDNGPAGVRGPPPAVFRADGPDRLWLRDITGDWTREGALYCCAIKDVFSNRVVGYSISNWMTAKLAVDAVRNALARRGDVAGCILHADTGSQFRGRAMARQLRLAIVVWIEWKYHRQRAQDRLGGLTPLEFEAKLTKPLTLAA
ncbi:DDE-type integrase/transposase/recombinase [Kocuria sp. UBA1838]|uniref:DDE-type integrase/transposase/recombinase n=1 Tax=Kocuria sp. UBA1838 TaxID=1946673 RepID=UPI0025800DB6|nr:DDE-type integrase/transposase/recombinase [Kocuria sp. UBA1838]